MSRVVAVVEGHTELAFVRDVLAPELGLQGVFLYASLVGMPGHKGGVGKYQRAQRDILTVLKNDAGAFCTKMFDYYGMPDSWPGRRQAAGEVHNRKASTVEDAIKADIVKRLGENFNPRRFVPYIQMHEFEALLFSDPVVLGEAIQVPSKASSLASIANQFGSPEEINDDSQSAPSRRILQMLPRYQKVVHGNIAAKRIGLQHMRGKCPHFDEWLKKLESLASAL